MTYYLESDTPKIKNKSYCESLQENIRQDREYIDSINLLFQLAKDVLPESCECKNGRSVLPEVQNHIQKIEKEIAKSSPDVFDGDIDKLVVEYRSKLDKQLSETPVTVCYKFIENPEFNVNYYGRIRKIIGKYLNEKQIEFTCERDSHDDIDDKSQSFLKFSFVKQCDNGPSSVTVLCSEYSDEIYIFSDCFLNYPLSLDDARKYSDCIKISDFDSNKKNNINKIELFRKLERALNKDKYNKVEALFKERFPEQDANMILSYALFHSLILADDDLYNDMISNFRLLIDENLEIYIPRLFSSNGRGFSCMFLYENGYLPYEFGENKDDILIEASKVYHKLCECSKKIDPRIIIGNEEYRVEFDKVHLYQLALYCYGYIDEASFREDKSIFNLYENFSSELIKNVDVNKSSEINSMLFKQLLLHSMRIGMPEILYFAKEHNIGFHSQKECDINEMVFTVLAFMSTCTCKKASEINNSNLFETTLNLGFENNKLMMNQYNIFRMLVDGFGDDIFSMMANNSNGKSKKDFKDKVLKWIDIFEKLYQGEPENKKMNCIFINERIKPVSIKGDVGIVADIINEENKIQKIKQILDFLTIYKDVNGWLNGEYAEKIRMLHCA